MAQITPFDFDGQPVRVVTIDGEPWFVLADLTKVLGLTQFRKERLDDEVIQNHPIPDSLGRTQMATIVSEPGMYEVVISYGVTKEISGPELMARALLEAADTIKADATVVEGAAGSPLSPGGLPQGGAS